MTDKQPEALRLTRKPCEYCGHDLPEGVNKKTRQERTYHFKSCDKRPRWEPESPRTVLVDADELRRLHEVNAELVEALGTVIRGVPNTWDGVKQAKAVLAKAQGESNEIS